MTVQKIWIFQMKRLTMFLIKALDLQTARERLKNVLRQWPEKGPDSKFEQFIKILQGLRKQEKRLKIMVFAFFKDTLRYLKKTP